MGGKPPDGGIDLVVLQRQRLYAQLQVQNEEIKRLEEVAANADKKRTDYEEVTLLLKRFWDRLCDDICHLCKQANPAENHVKPEDAKPAQPLTNGVKCSDPFLLALVSNDHTLADGLVKAETLLQEEFSEVERHLQARAQETSAQLRLLLELIHRQRSAADELMLTLKGAGAGEALQQHAATCAAQAAALRGEVDRCRAAERAAKDEARHLNGQLGAERLRCRELDARLADSEAELLVAKKRLVQATEEGAAKGAGASAGGAAPHGSNSTPASGSGTGAAAAEVADRDVQIAELRGALDKAEGALLQEQADHLRTKTELRAALATVSDEVWVPRTQTYAHLVAELDRARRDDAEARTLAQQVALERDQLDLHAKQLARKVAEGESYARMLKASEETRARLEGDKRQMLAEAQRLEGALVQERARNGEGTTLTEMQQMLGTVSQERDHLRQRLAANQSSDAQERAAAEAAAACTSQKAAELAAAALQERLADASVELDSMRNQLDSALARQTELRAMVKVLTTVCTEPWDAVEGRTKVSALEAQVRGLQAELSGPGRSAANSGADCEPSTSAPAFDPSSSSRAAFSKLWQSRVEEARAERDEARLAVGRLERALDSATRDLAASKAEVDEFMTEVEITGQAFEDMQGQNSRLLGQLAERDEALALLQSKDVKGTRLNQALQEEVLHLQAMLEQRDREKEELVRLLDTCDRANSDHRAALLANVEQLHQLGLEVSSLQREVQGKDARLVQKDVEVAALEEQLVSRKRALESSEQELVAESHKRRRADDEVRVLDRRLRKAREVGADTEQVSELTEEVKALKRMLVCSICNERKNDCIITKCGHLFSRECLQRNMENRNRKCPKCGIPFGGADVHDAYL